MFKTDNEILEVSYYQTDEPKVLIEYACPTTYRYFEERSKEVIRLPKEALAVTGLTPFDSDTNTAEKQMAIIRIGCKNGPPDPGCQTSETTYNDGEDNDCFFATF